MPNYRFRLNIDSMERARPPPRRFPFVTMPDEVDKKYVLLRARSVRHRGSSLAPEKLMAVPSMICREDFFADSGRGDIRTVLCCLSSDWTAPPWQLVERLAAMAAAIGRTIASNPTYADAPVVPLDLYLEIEPGPGPSGPLQRPAADPLEAVLELSLAEAPCRAFPADETAIRELREVARSSGEYKDRDRCIVCLEEFGGPTLDDDEKIVRTPCSHLFHRKCIVEWFSSSHLCPLCRYAMPKVET